jgi:replicative DNA helicase
VLLDNDALAVVAPIVSPESFYARANETVFAAMLALAARGQPIDVITLAAALRPGDRIAAVGGAQYLGELTDAVPTVAHVEEHARIVADCALVRRVELAAGSLMEAVRGGEGVARLRELAAAALDAVGDGGAARGPRSFADLAEEFYAHIEAVAARGPGIDGVTTGLPALDALLAGLHDDELVVVGARPAMGKSALGLQMAMAATRATGKPALCFSVEMGALSLFARAACGAARVDSTALRHGLLDRDAFDRLVAAVSELAALPVYIDDGAGTTVHDVRARSLAMKARRGLCLVEIDYLQLLAAAASRRDDNREQEVSGMSRGLKSLARELHVPVVALSQLNRGVDKRPDKRPVPSDLRESGALEQDADVVMFIYRDEVYNRDTTDRGVAEIIVTKQRHGPTDTVRVRWEGAFTQFAHLERDDAPPPRRDAPADEPDELDESERF